MSYKQTKSTAILRISDGAIIPDDPKNSDYQEYLTWEQEGGVIAPVDPPTPEEIAAAAQGAKDAQDATAARAYSKLTALKTMTPAQIQTWVAANVTNLAQAQDAIATLAIGVGILARRI